MRQIRLVVLSSVLCLAMASFASAQDDGFVVGYTDVGPTLGLGGIGDAGFAIGGRFEHGFRALPDLGNGVLGIGVSVDRYSYDYDVFGTDYGFSYTPIAVTGNYHFRLENRKIDPFVGAGLGYLRVSFDCGGSPFCDDVSNSGIYFVGHGGIRYFWRPAMALYADIGHGAATLNVGLMFKIR